MRLQCKVMVGLKRTPGLKNKTSAWVPSDNEVLSRMPMIRYASNTQAMTLLSNENVMCHILVGSILRPNRKGK